MPNSRRQAAFHRADKDNSGNLDRAEVLGLIQTYSGEKMPAKSDDGVDASPFLLRFHSLSPSLPSPPPSSPALSGALSPSLLSRWLFSLFGGCSPSFRPPSCYIYPTPSLPPPAPPLSFARARLLGFLSVEIVGRGGGGGGGGLRGSSAKRRRLAFIRSSAFPVPISFCLG